jgi:hypothetical protein
VTAELEIDKSILTSPHLTERILSLLTLHDTMMAHWWRLARVGAGSSCPAPQQVSNFLIRFGFLLILLIVNVMRRISLSFFSMDTCEHEKTLAISMDDDDDISSSCQMDDDDDTSSSSCCQGLQHGGRQPHQQQQPTPPAWTMTTTLAAAAAANTASVDDDDHTTNDDTSCCCQ